MDRTTVYATIIAFVILIIPFWRMSEKLGYPGFLGLLGAFPLINVLYFYLIGFVKAPVELEMDRYRSKFGELPEETSPDEMKNATVCLSCGYLIDHGEKSCPSCGWTYDKA
ncbi:hypothetical protein HYR53_04305 [Candidatus Acetothermia bacterium]|nr:hypothetical protein [Candidatus Acetothermia bacterium]